MKRLPDLPLVCKRGLSGDAVRTGKAVRNTNVKSVICFLGVQKVQLPNRTKIEPRKRLIIEIREIFVRGLRAAFPPRVCRSLNRESVPYINSFSGAAFPPSAAAAHAIPHPAFSHISPANACRRLRNRCLHPIVPRAQDVNVVSAAGLSPRHVLQHACAELPHAPHTPPPPPSMAPSARRMGFARTLPLMFHMK